MSNALRSYVKGLFLSVLSVMSFASFAQEVKNISADELLAADKSNWLILDVRSEKEFNSGHVPGALNIAHTEIADNLQKLLAHKDKPIVVYCRSGFRAGKATDILLDQGFSQLMHLQGDMLNWQKAGHTIEQ